MNNDVDGVVWDDNGVGFLGTKITDAFGVKSCGLDDLND